MTEKNNNGFSFKSNNLLPNFNFYKVKDFHSQYYSPKNFQFEYIETPLHHWTFQSKKIKLFVEKWSKGLVLNLFAGKTKLNVNEIRVDKDPEFNPDYCIEAFDFVNDLTINNNQKFDTIILDPPYSYRKSMEFYHGHKVSSFRKLKDILNNIINDNGIVISFGYDSTGMSGSRGYRKIALAIINHKGAQHDTIALVEEKFQVNLTNFINQEKE